MKIFKYKPIRMSDGRRILPYCDYGWHQGVIHKDYLRVCWARECSHYRELDVRNLAELVSNNKIKIKVIDDMKGGAENG